MDDGQRGMALLGAGYGFGAAGMVAPKLVAATFGLGDVSDEYVALMRMFSTRNMALAAAFQLIKDDAKLRKGFFAVAAAMFSADTAAALLTAAAGRINWRPALSLGITSGVLAAIAASGAAAE